MAIAVDHLRDVRSERFVLGSLISVGNTSSDDFAYRWLTAFGSSALDDDTVKESSRLFSDKASQAVFWALVTLCKMHVGSFNTTTLYREVPKELKEDYVILTRSDIPEEDIDDQMIVLDELALEGSGSRDDFEVHVASIRRARQSRQAYSQLSDLAEGIKDGKVSLEELEGASRRIEEIAVSSRKVELLTPQDSFAMIRATQTSGIRIPTGYQSLDNIIGGFEEGRLYIFAGRPGSGKSLANVNSAIAALEQGACVLFVSVEMPAKEIYTRIIAATALVEYKDIWDDIFAVNKTPLTVAQEDDFPPHCTKERKDNILRAAEVEDALIRHGHFHLASLDQQDVDYLHVKDLIREAAKHASEHDMPLVVFIDYIQLLSKGYSGSRRGLNTNDIIGEMSGEFKKLAVSLSVPIILSAQLNRDAAAGKPTVSMLRDSGALEQDADIIVLIDRECSRDESAPKSEVTFIVGKQRGGATGEVKLRFRPEVSAILDKSSLSTEKPSQGNPEQDGDNSDGYSVLESTDEQ